MAKSTAKKGVKSRGATSGEVQPSGKSKKRGGGPELSKGATKRGGGPELSKGATKRGGGPGLSKGRMK